MRYFITYVKEHEMGKAYSTHGRGEKCVQYAGWEN